MQKTIPDEQVKEIHHKTQGWIAGILFLFGEIEGNHFKGYPLKGDHVGEFFNYFTSELMRNTDNTTRDFLLKTWVFPEFTPLMTEKLTGIKDSDKIIQRLYRKNFFIERLNKSKATYRYHNLFRNFLASESEKMFSEEDLGTLRREAATLLEDNGKTIDQGCIMDNLWPDTDGDRANWSFKSTLKRLRNLLGNKESLLIHEGRISLNDKYFWIDLWVLENLIAGAEKESRERNFERVAGISERIFALYKGDFLKGDLDISLIIRKRELLKLQLIHIVEDIGSHCERAEDFRKAVRWYEKGLELDGISEYFYQRLMLYHRNLGNRSKAAELYKRCMEALETATGLAPSTVTKAIYKSIVNHKH